MKLVVLLLVAALGAWGGEVVDITETGGTHLLGELVAENGAGVTVRGTANGGTWSRTVQRAGIESVVYPEREYPQRAAAASDAASQAQLARWCLEETLRDRAEKHAREALAADPELPEAREVMVELGWVPDDGKWLRAEAWLAAHGLAAVAGQVMTLAERDRVVAAQNQLNQDRTASAPLVASATAADAAVARDRNQHDQLDAEKATIAKRLAADQDAVNGETQAQQKLDQAQKQAQRQAGRRARYGGGTGQTNGAASQAEAAAQADLAAAQKLAAGAQRDIDTLNKRQAAIDQQIQDADAAMNRDLATQKAAAAAAQPARDKLAASERALKDLLAGIPTPPDLPPELAIALRADGH